MLVVMVKDKEEMATQAAAIIASQIRRKPDSVLGFATGSTPLGLYKELIRLHREEGLSFSKVTTFNLDEYVGLPPRHPQSYNHFMWTNLFEHLDVTPEKVHMPDGMAEDIDGFCEWYEERIAKVGGIDIQILGIGANGHLAFNEPGSSLGSRTRIKTLTGTTMRDNARFFDDADKVPRFAITMGIGTIMEAKRLLLLASGEAKAEAIRMTLEGPVTAMVPATIVQMHRYAQLLLDPEAASRLEYKHEHGKTEPR